MPSHARRISFPNEVSMFGDRCDEIVRRGFRIGCGEDETGIGLAAGQRGRDAARLQQLRAFAEHQNRFAVPVLILDELEGPSVGTEMTHCVGATRQDDGVVQAPRGPPPG